jgi:hypothetical protein
MKISSISCTPPFQFSCATNIIHTVTASRNDGYVDRLLRNLHGARQSRAGKTFLHRNIGYVHPHANGVKSQCQDPDVIRVGGRKFHPEGQASETYIPLMLSGVCIRKASADLGSALLHRTFLQAADEKQKLEAEYPLFEVGGRP